MSERKSSFNVHILAADHVFYEGPCESLIVPAPLGQMGILANHSKHGNSHRAGADGLPSSGRLHAVRSRGRGTGKGRKR